MCLLTPLHHSFMNAVFSLVLEGGEVVVGGESAFAKPRFAPPPSVVLSVAAMMR